MNELLDSLSSDNLVLLCVIMGIVALFLAIAISFEIFNSNRKYKKQLEEQKEKNEKDENALSSTAKLNIKESPDIKYVDEDDVELEKTKAKIELANLRNLLKKKQKKKLKRKLRKKLYKKLIKKYLYLKKMNQLLKRLKQIKKLILKKTNQKS